MSACRGTTRVFKNLHADEEVDQYGSFTNELDVSVDEDGFVMIEDPEDELNMQLYLGNVDELIALLQALKATVGDTSPEATVGDSSNE